MSIRLMSFVWDVVWPTQNHLLVMLKLADHANDEGGKVWPSVATIARQAQCSERTVQNVLKAGRDCGLLKVLEKGGGTQPTIYAINVELLEALNGEVLEGGADRIEIPEKLYPHVSTDTGATVAPLSDCTGATDGGRGAKLLQGRGAKLLHPNHHKPPIEPPLRAGAREGENFDLGSEGVKPSPSLPVFTIQPADTSWGAWIEHFRKTGRDEFAVDATEKRRICASSRWPQENTVVFEPKPRKALSKTSKRMTGDAA